MYPMLRDRTEIQLGRTEKGRGERERKKAEREKAGGMKREERIEGKERRKEMREGGITVPIFSRICCLARKVLSDWLFK